MLTNNRNVAGHAFCSSFIFINQTIRIYIANRVHYGLYRIILYTASGGQSWNYHICTVVMFDVDFKNEQHFHKYTALSRKTGYFQTVIPLRLPLVQNTLALKSKYAVGSSAGRRQNLLKLNANLSLRINCFIFVD